MVDKVMTKEWVGETREGGREGGREEDNIKSSFLCLASPMCLPSFPLLFPSSLCLAPTAGMDAAVAGLALTYALPFSQAVVFSIRSHAELEMR